MKDKKNITGFVEYLDKRGLSDKALRVLQLWDAVFAASEKFKKEFKKLNFSLISDPVLVISDSRFKDIENALSDMFESWDRLSFPFKGHIYSRSATFETNFDFSLPNKTIDRVENISENAKNVLGVFRELGDHQQYLIHPRVSEEDARKYMYGVRFQTVPSGVTMQVGKGVHQIYLLDYAPKKWEFTSPFSPDEIDSEIREFVLPLRLISSFLDETLVRLGHIKKNQYPVYEMKLFKVEGKWIAIWFDYEVMR